MNFFSRYRQWVIAGVLLIHVTVVMYEGYRDAPVYDEVAHLASGISHWKMSHFALYRANPPLPRMIAALPVIAAGANYDWSRVRHSPGSRCEFSVGRAFVKANGTRAFWLYTLGRWAMIPFTILGAWLCLVWGTELFGPNAGLLSLTMWCLSPTVIANAHLVTPDLPATSTGLLAAFAFYRWLKRPCWKFAFFAGAAMGLALLTKTTWIILFGLWPLLGLIQCFRSGQPLKIVSQTTMIVGLGLWILNAGYAFQGSMAPLGTYDFVSCSLSGREIDNYGLGNKFRGTFMETVPVPLPSDFVLGVDITKRVFERRIPNYLRMSLSKDGWWYYYLYCMAVKMPLGILALFVGGLWCIFRYRDSKRSAFDWLSVFLVPLFLFAFVSSNTGINRHFRYVLPSVPYVFLVAGVLTTATQHSRFARGLLATGVTCSAITLFLAIPHTGSYFNEVAGGAANGWKHLASSNIDWGQDLQRLKEWQDQHPEIETLGLAYYGCIDPSDVGVNYQMPPTGPLEPRVYPLSSYGPHPGTFAISVHFLTGAPAFMSNGRGGIKSIGAKRYIYFRDLKPSETVGSTINIYHLTLEDANELRGQLSLPPIEQEYSR